MPILYNVSIKIKTRKTNKNKLTTFFVTCNTKKSVSLILYDSIVNASSKILPANIRRCAPAG